MCSNAIVNTTCVFVTQERIIERVKEQRDRDDREKTEEIDCNKKELKELKERLSLLQGDLSDREVRNGFKKTNSH